MFVGFIVIHVGMVIITGLRNNLRAMVTGWFQISHSGGSHETGSAH
jgi:thiosulfate reductase cytochrome b subunit